MHRSIRYAIISTSRIAHAFVLGARSAVDLFGLPSRTYATSVLLDCGVDTVGTALLDYGDKLVTLSYSKTGQGAAPSEIIGDKGTIAVDLISVYGGVQLHQDGEVLPLSNIPDHGKAMGNEASDFYHYIIDRKSYAAEYRSMMCQMSDAADLLYEIRKQSKIRFPQDKGQDTP